MRNTDQYYLELWPISYKCLVSFSGQDKVHWNKIKHTVYHIPGKFGNNNVWQKWMDKHFSEKVWQMNRSAKRLLIVTTNLDGFSLANH